MADKVENKKETKFLNPFDKGVTYVDFLNAIGKKSVDDYCKGNLEQDQIDWLKEDLKNLKK